MSSEEKGRLTASEPDEETFRAISPVADEDDVPDEDDALDSDQIGTIGQDAFVPLCSQALIAPSAPKKDKYGWDYQSSGSVLATHSIRPETCFVQVKTVSTGATSARIKLSNWRRMARSQGPRFVVAVALHDRDVASFHLVTLYGFVRIGAAVRMCVRDFEDESEHAALVLREKGGKDRRIACHHKTPEFLRAYVAAAGFEARSKEPLFQTVPGWQRKLSGVATTIDDALRAVKRRCRMPALPSSLCTHSFRASGIAMHKENGERLEDAQELAGHADARTTRLYVRNVRKARKLAHAEVERV
jgi:hypothetical protein